MSDRKALQLPRWRGGRVAQNFKIAYQQLQAVSPPGHRPRETAVCVPQHGGGHGARDAEADQPSR